MASPGGQEPQPDNSSSNKPGTPVAEPEVDKELEQLWGQVKATVKKDLSPEDAQLLDSITVKDLSEDKLLEKLARDQLGPVLSQAGINMDPFVFVSETLKLVLFLQFVSCGLTFYGTENLAHFPVGSAFIAAAGLAMGYLTRPTLQIDYILAPVYNTFLTLFIPNATYEVGPPTQAALQGLLNKLGVIVAVAFFLPRWLWGWSTDDCVHFVVPLASGWFLFDIWFMVAVTLVLRNNDEL